MLYDKRWGRTETKPDVFSLEGLIAWLEKQPADAWYDFCDSGGCLLAQWARSIDPNMIEPEYEDSDGGGSYKYLVFGEVVNLHRFKQIAIRSDENFGAALERARAQLR